MGAETTVAWPAWEDPAFYEQDPEVIHAAMAAQRRAEPVYWYERGGFWVLSKWEDVRYAGSHPEVFSNQYGFLIGDSGDPEKIMPNLPPWAQEALSKPGLTAAEKRGIIARGKVTRAYDQSPNGQDLHMILLDPPRHREVRRVLTQALSPKLVRSLGPMIAEATDELLDRITPGEVTDVVPIVGGIPAALIASLLGVPRDMHDQFAAWADNSLKFSAMPPGSDPEEVARLRSSVEELMAYANELIDERRAAGAQGDDLISAFLRSELDGAPISPAMMMIYTTSVISAGSDTTRHMLSFLVHALAVRPDQRELLLERPELRLNAVEETLRYYPVVWGQARTAMEDVEMGGKQIAKDDFVFRAFASANRDEDIYENPDEFDITRSFKGGHVGFGWGEHVCPGSPLVRADAPIILERILNRFRSWEPAGTPERQTSLLLNGLRSLPIKFHAR